MTLHQKRVHRAPEDRVRFRCDRCAINLKTQAAKTNHEKTCSEGGGWRRGRGGGGGSVGIVGGGYLGGTMLDILGVVGGRVGVGGEGLMGIGGSVRSAAGCSRRRTWRGTGRVVARSGTKEGDIAPDGAECQEEKKVVRKYIRKLVHNAKFVCVYGPSFEAQVFNKLYEKKKTIYRLLTNYRTKFLTSFKIILLVNAY